MERTIYTVLIDDDVNYSTDLAGIAREYNIAITPFASLEKAREEMPEMKDLDFIILDGKCFTNEDDSVVDFDFILEARLAISEIENTRGKKIPHCLNTGYVEDAKLLKYKKQMRVFEKVTNQEELFQYIVDVVSHDDDYQIKCNNKKVFDLFEADLMPKAYQEELLKLFHEIRREDIKANKDALRKMRPFIEAAYENLKKQYRDLIPDAFFDENGPNVSGITKHLAGYRWNESKKRNELKGPAYMPIHIYYLTDTLKNATSKTAMHHYDNNISNYLVTSCFYGLLEFLLWYKGFTLTFRAGD